MFFWKGKTCQIISGIWNHNLEIGSCINALSKLRLSKRKRKERVFFKYMILLFSSIERKSQCINIIDVYYYLNDILFMKKKTRWKMLCMHSYIIILIFYFLVFSVFCLFMTGVRHPSMTGLVRRSLIAHVP